MFGKKKKSKEPTPNPYEFGYPVDINIEKLNPAQPLIAEEEGESKLTTKVDKLFENAYNLIEVVNRGVNLLVDSASYIDYDVLGPLPFSSVHGGPLRQKSLHTLLNHRPNPFEDINSFRRNIFIDLILEGNAFIFFDGKDLYLMPATNVEVILDSKTFVKGYKYSRADKLYTPEQVIHIRDNSACSIFRGDSRLKSARESILTLHSMLQYQKNFFDNGAVPGLVLMTNDILSPKIKDRIVSNWVSKYNPRSGGRRPVVLDGAMKIDKINSNTFQELDFKDSVLLHEERILKSLGIPPVLLSSGNNANISPNLKLFYYDTVLPLVEKVVSALERFFAFDVDIETSNVAALRPDMRELQEYLSGLVNNGILTGNEARIALRYEPMDTEDMNTIRIPANIAGSAAGGSGGGRPTEPADD